MTIFVGNIEVCTLGDIQVGSDEAQEVYVGDTKIYPCNIPGSVTAITSKLYPIQESEKVEGVSTALTFAEAYEALRESVDGASAAIVSGVLDELVLRHTVHDGDIASVDGDGAAIQSGSLDEVVLRHTVHDDDIASVDGDGAAIQSGSLDEVVIRHSVYDPAEVDGTAAAIISGTLEAA